MENMIFGKWRSCVGNTWFFDTDGFCRVNDGEWAEYGITETKLAVWLPCEDGTVNPMVFDVSMSSDGKTLLGNSGDGVSMWLTKADEDDDDEDDDVENDEGEDDEEDGDESDDEENDDDDEDDEDENRVRRKVIKDNIAKGRNRWWV